MDSVSTTASKPPIIVYKAVIAAIEAISKNLISMLIPRIETK